MKKGSGVLSLAIMFVFAVFASSALHGESAELTGVKFEKMDFEKILAKAQNEKKNVMVDAFSTN